MLECCSMLAGTMFQMNWNPIPANMESEYKIAITHPFVKKHVVRVYFKGGPTLNNCTTNYGILSMEGDVRSIKQFIDEKPLGV